MLDEFERNITRNPVCSADDMRFSIISEIYVYVTEDLTLRNQLHYFGLYNLCTRLELVTILCATMIDIESPYVTNTDFYNYTLSNLRCTIYAITSAVQTVPNCYLKSKFCSETIVS